MVINVDLLLVASLGFLGSFGHCAGMCGPLTLAFSMPPSPQEIPKNPWNRARSQLQFHLLLNLGRLLSYGLGGSIIGGLGSVLIASGQMAGVGSDLRRIITLIIGFALVWYGLAQILPQLFPKVPLLNPLAFGTLHDRLQGWMLKLAPQQRAWTPLLLGLTWGFIPCGFLYAAQLKAAETGHWLQGAATLIAFGLGTLPVLLTVGVSAGLLTQDRRSQLFRLGGWITLLIGLLTLSRTGSAMMDYSSYGGLVCLILALLARPLAPLWPTLLTYRRFIGVSAFVLSTLHLFQILQHRWNWQTSALDFMLPPQRWGTWCGIVALLLITPAALTSFDRAQKWLGRYWRSLHLLSLPALLLATLHSLLLGNAYLGNFQPDWQHYLATAALITPCLLVILCRQLGLQWLIPQSRDHSQP